MNYDPNDPLIRKEIENRIARNEVGYIINRINDGLADYYIDDSQMRGDPNYQPGIRRDDMYGYAEEALRERFTQGKCNVYAYILYKVFEGYSCAYEDGDHIAVKIGDKFYDFNGWNDMFSKKNLRPCDIEYNIDYYRKELHGEIPKRNIVHLGGWPNRFDDELMRVGIEAGRKVIYKNVYPEIENSEGGRSSR